MFSIMQIKCRDYHILPSQARARFVTRCLRHNSSQWPLLPSPSLWPFDVCIAGSREPHQIQRRLSKNYDKPTRHRTNTDSNLANLIPRRRREGALVSSRHRTCLSVKDRCNHQCFLAFTDLSINELTQHDDTVRIKAYQADVTKKVPGLQMSNTG